LASFQSSFCNFFQSSFGHAESLSTIAAEN
jgi:hypothetical protein